MFFPMLPAMIIASGVGRVCSGHDDSPRFPRDLVRVIERRDLKHREDGFNTASSCNLNCLLAILRRFQYLSGLTEILGFS